MTTKLIVEGGRTAEEVMIQLCQRVLDGNGIPDEWKTSVMVPIFKGNGDVINCGSFRRVKLQEHTMKIVEIMSDIIRALVDFDETEFVWLHAWNATTDALFVVRRMPKEHRAKAKGCTIVYMFC